MQRDILKRKPSGALLDRFFAYLPYLHFLRSPIVTGLLLLGFPFSGPLVEILSRARQSL